jgi:hypothetical protein
MNRTHSSLPRVRWLRRGARFGVTVVLATSLLGCPNRASEVRAVEIPEAERVAFEIDDLAAGRREGRTMLLLDFELRRQDCQQDCTMWLLVRAPGAIAETPSSHIIRYGRSPGGMSESTPARPLEPGSYELGGTLQRHDSNGNFERSIRLVGAFDLIPDESGRYRVHNGGGDGR